SVQNGAVAENEIGVVADVDKSDRELEGIAVENGAVDRDGEGEVKEIEIPVVVEEVAVAASTEALECADSDVVGTTESKDGEKVESGSVVGVDVSDEKNKVHDTDLESEVGGEVSESAEKNEIHDTELKNVVDADVSESAEKNEIHDAELETSVNAEVTESAEKNEIHDAELETSVNAEVTESAEKNEIPDVELEAVVEAEVSESAEKNKIPDVELESVVDAEVSESAEKNEIPDIELETVVDAEVSESDKKNEIPDVELETVVDAEVSESDEKNKIPDVELETVVDAEVSESVEKNEIPVHENGANDNTNVEECAVEDSQNGLEKLSTESVSVTVVENGLAEVEVSTEGKAIPSDISELERSVEISEPQVDLQGKDLAELIKSGTSDDADEGVIQNQPSVDLNNIEEESEAEAEPSDNAVKGEGGSIEVSEPEMKNDAIGSEAEPSTETVESEAEVSNNVMQSEADPSLQVQDLKTDVVGSVAEPSVEAETSTEESKQTNEDLKTSQEASATKPSVEAEPSAEESKQTNEDLKTSQEASATDALDAQNMVTEVVRKPFYWLIRVPRYDDDENIKEQIQHALQQVEEKTKIRDEIRAESQTKKASCKEYGQEFRAAVQEERAARDLLKSKRQEMDSVQSTMNRLNNAISVGDIDSKIRNMEHMIQHETLPLKEEKQLIRQIKQLKQSRGELSTIIAKQDQSQSLDEKDNIEEQSKQLQLLRKDLDVLRNNVLKAEAITKAAKKKYDEESNQVSAVLIRFKTADDVRQEAFVKLQTLKRKLHEKSKYFWEYKNASIKAQELAAQGKKEEVQSLCIDEAERIHEMWKNDEFRRNYLRCNTRSTLRRLQTYDGRMLGPDEEPPVIPNNFIERASKNDSLVSRSIPEQQMKSIPTESVTVNAKDEPAAKVVVQKPEISQTTSAKKPAKPAPSEKKSAVPVRRWGDESDEDKEPKEPVRTKEEEERILKAEKARKEEEETKLKEMKRLEEIEKAKEALQRKKRNAEKAQQRALFKAQKEAEQKEKEREKRARKKGKKKAVSTEDAVEKIEQESAASPSTETLTRTLEESDQSEKPVEVTKRSVKPSQFIKQNKVKSLPMSIRNRGKRRIQPWMWVVIAVLVIAALFYIGNNSSLRSSFQSFGF
ncbi:hypothetical protein RYX36_021749, partial [Vicia faba]